ncbi:MAG: bifunctional phosphopantothenoylcysteine decarboxylase/phosphopantothenate--cysteine ligase CoaBC [Acidobacteria bacterium]|nr:bifunctional phosphopantothenoylcysteine decarboxylase/phosphopantothenate--cysteine ligase CoaBC [Acidobacteriota bacterium]
MKIILGVTGCIGAYKAAEVLRQLQQRGATVRVVMTRSATDFVGRLTFEALSGQPVLTDMFAPGLNTQIKHIEVARWADLLLVAPATANIIAKFAHGLADDLLTTVYVSATCPTVIAPAMNVEMWRHAATQENIATLRVRGVEIIEPESGFLACGEVGEGRLAEPDQIAERAIAFLKRSGRDDLASQHVLVTAGPTCEDMDPVRFLTNRSSGKMGYALAEAALARGADVTLISGPTDLVPPARARFISVWSTEEMYQAVMQFLDETTIVVKAAAVADFRPRTLQRSKIKKGGRGRVLELEPTPDILAEIGRRKEHRIVVGFAAETDDPIENGRKKLKEKSLDLIVINDVTAEGAGFNVDTNQATLIDREDRVIELPLMSKRDMADRIFDHVVKTFLKAQTPIR